jgi:peptidoglycan/xylan/chitin deacetylase (PgdA/CDA1 family)
MYHSISTVTGGPLRHLAVPPALLTDQLVALREAGFTLLGLTEALRRHDTDPVGARVVAVTFDDGFANFLTGGLAALAAARARATLYLAVGHLGRGPASWLGRRGEVFGPLMDWSGVADVVAAGVEIGSHNMVHRPMDVLDPGGPIGRRRPPRPAGPHADPGPVVRLPARLPRSGRARGGGPGRA